MENIIEINGKKYKKVAPDLNWKERHVYYNREWYQLIQEEEKNGWEIIAFQHKRQGNIWEKNVAGKFSTKSQFDFMFGNSPESFFLRHPDVYIIYSVKRLSDGEIFTVEDRVYYNKVGTISRFDISKNNDGIYADLNYSDCHRHIGVALQKLVKFIKQPLFTTEDGKDIFEGDEYFYLNDDIGAPWRCSFAHKSEIVPYKIFSTREAALSWIEKNKPKPLFVTFDNVELWKKEDTVYSVCPKGTWETWDDNLLRAGVLSGHGKLGINGRPWKNWLHFSTKEARDKYILENKPVLSLKDIEHATGTMDGHKYISLVNIVKGRL